MCIITHNIQNDIIRKQLLNTHFDVLIWYYHKVDDIDRKNYVLSDIDSSTVRLGLAICVIYEIYYINIVEGIKVMILE